MNRSVETVLRIVNLTSSGLLAGSLGFGNAPLIPGWEEELSAREARMRRASDLQHAKFFNAIGPTALATSLTLAIGSRNSSRGRRVLDLLSALSLAGVLGATFLGTVPIGRKFNRGTPIDYPSQHFETLGKTWTRAHTVRTALGVSAFICAAAANVLGSRHAK
jgi:anthrone oxygenase-like protein